MRSTIAIVMEEKVKLSKEEDCIHCKNIIYTHYLLGLDRVYQKCEKCGEQLDMGGLNVADEL